MKAIIALLFPAMLCLAACTGGHSPSVRHALERSGSNRAELEKVLQHYAQKTADSLKLRAAEFLIGNMPGHYSLKNDSVEKTITTKYAQLPLFLTNTLFCGHRQPDSAVRVEDVQVVTSAFLIKHIDRTFEQWNSVAWSKEFPFDIFCEYVLPYRMDCEPLERIVNDTVTILTDTVVNILNYYGISRHEFRQNIAYQLIEVKPNFPFRLPKVLGDYKTYADFVFSRKSCIPISYRELSLNRKKCIPSYVDQTLHWSGRNGGHFWSGCITPYTYMEYIEDPFATTAKVYRQTYSHNKIPIPDGVNHIPKNFTNPFLRDVTDIYFKTFDLSIALHKTLPTKYAYLAVFNEQQWQPVAWGKLSKIKASFKKVGGGAAYLVLGYNGNEEVPLSYPFIVNAHGQVHILKPNHAATISLHLTRKSNLTLEKLMWGEMLEKLTIEGSNEPDFKHSKLLCTINNISYKPFYHHQANSAKAYRYYRLTQPDKSDFTLAELIFYTVDNLRLLPKAVINNGKPLAMKNEKNVELQKAFDGDYLSYVTIRRSGTQHNSIVFDFGKPVTVGEMLYMPRNDENYIYPDNLYELFYWDTNRWVSMGQQIATDYSLDYHNVPSEAIYWLHNHTKGREERIFTYENGNVKFW